MSVISEFPNILIPLFPLTFIIHEAEEIAVQHQWMLKHKEHLVRRFPKANRIIEHLAQLNTKAFIIAVVEETVIILAATAYILNVFPYALEVWSAIFIAFFLHLIIHLAQTIVMRGYVPGIISTVLLIPYALLEVKKIWCVMNVDTFMFCTLSGVLLMMINLIFAHWLGIKITK